ncbi:MAG: S8 family peptidase, partial [Candidatus Hodarchaeales archaeon]
MRIKKMFQLSIVCFFGLLLILPSFHSTQSNPFPLLLQNELHTQLENDFIPSSINFLFQYSSSSEKEEIIDSLKPFDPSFFHFYRNFPIGLVSLKQNMLQNLHRLDPTLKSLLQQSRNFQVLPSIEKLAPQALASIQQSIYTPPPVIISAPALWENGIDGTNSKIAIIDSGIDSTHEDFDNRIVFEKSFVSETFGFSEDETPQDLHGHGTHVAGIAAGSDSSFPGVAYKAELYNLKVANLAGSSTQEALLEAVDEAIAQNVDVISISLGFSTSNPWGSGDLLTLALDNAVESGISVVTSAGNDGNEGEYASITTPASTHKGISVGATNGSTNIVEFSSRGPSYDYKVDPDVVAPGYQIAAPLASGGVLEIAYESIVGIDFNNYIILSGTSMAAPVVSGAIALLKQQFPTASPSAIRAALQESARFMNGESLYVQGSGLIDVNEASGLLQRSNIDSKFEIISSLPRAQFENSIELVERIRYPGDTAHLGISLVNGKEGTITWDISESIRDFIEIDSSPVSLSEGDYHHMIVNVSVPFSTAPSIYSGNISYSYLGKNYFLPLEFTIDNPKANIYLYSHDSYSDDSEFYNYRSLGNLLSENKFDMNDYSNTITWENLSKSDIMIISDLEYPLSNQEISYISNFHNNNGSILLVTSAFPYFNPDPYEQIAEILDLPIFFSDSVK